MNQQQIEKVKQGLRCIAQIGECDCDHCDYAENGYPSALYKCQEKFASDALSVIEQMEQEIERLKDNLDLLLPVLHGEWEDKEYSIGKCYAICSLCKKSSIGYAKDTGFGFEYSFPNYCPHCGAKMKQEGR